jgi:hypothetical protein
MSRMSPSCRNTSSLFRVRFEKLSELYLATVGEASAGVGSLLRLRAGLPRQSVPVPAPVPTPVLAPAPFPAPPDRSPSSHSCCSSHSCSSSCECICCWKRKMPSSTVPRTTYYSGGQRADRADREGGQRGRGAEGQLVQLVQAM